MFVVLSNDPGYRPKYASVFVMFVLVCVAAIISGCVAAADATPPSDPVTATVLPTVTATDMPEIQVTETESAGSRSRRRPQPQHLHQHPPLHQFLPRHRPTATQRRQPAHVCRTRSQFAHAARAHSDSGPAISQAGQYHQHRSGRQRRRIQTGRTHRHHHHRVDKHRNRDSDVALSTTRPLRLHSGLDN